MIFPSAYLYPEYGGVFNPYFGGFGHVNLPQSGAGYWWPSYTMPFNFQSPTLYAYKALFVA